MGLKGSTLFRDVYNGKRVLITGDTGFKGSWLAAWLVEMGAKVFGYALPPKTERDNFVTSNLSNKIKHEDGDIRDYRKLLKYFNNVEPDFAFHLAAQPLVIESYSDPRYTFETNLMGTVNFFEAVRKTSTVKAAINITSDKCYKNNEWVWGYRESDPMGGKDPYSASKGASELITAAYLNSFFVQEGTANIASARAGNVIGGGDWADFRIVPDFFRSLEKNEVLQLRNPEATRPWQHVLEPLSGYLNLAMMLYLKGKKYSGGWNFGPIVTTNQSVKTLVEKMIQFTGKGNYIVIDKGNKLPESALLNLDISRAMHLLNWKPVLTFEETVKFTVDSYIIENNDKSTYKNRIEQIRKYCELAIKRDISWVNRISNNNKNE